MEPLLFGGVTHPWRVGGAGDMTGRLEEFLARVEVELGGDGDEERLSDTMRELRTHLEQCVEELYAEGHPNPEEEAVARFGDRGRIVEEIREVERKCLTRWDRLAMWLALSMTATVVLSDLLVDLSSWLTGSDFKTYGVAFPVAMLGLV